MGKARRVSPEHALRFRLFGFLWVFPVKTDGMVMMTMEVYDS